MSRCCLLHFRCQHERRQLEHKRNDPERTHTGDCFSYSVTVVGVENGNSRSLRPSHPLESPLVKETTAPEGSTSSLVSGVEYLLLASLPASISESSSDSAELDSSSDSSLFPLSGLGERSKDSQKRGRGSPPPGRPDQTKINGTDFMTQVSESRVLSSYMYQHSLPFFSI